MNEKKTARRKAVKAKLTKAGRTLKLKAIQKILGVKADGVWEVDSQDALDNLVYEKIE